MKRCCPSWDDPESVPYGAARKNEQPYSAQIKGMPHTNVKREACHTQAGRNSDVIFKQQSEERMDRVG